MTNDLVRWAIVIALFAHGIGHILFMPPLADAMRVQVTGHSWLLAPTIGDGATRLLATVAAAAAMALFVAAAGGIILSATWWRPLALAGAVVSAALIAVLWDGLPTSSALWAAAFDAAVLVALLVVSWPPRELVGS